MHKLGTTAAGVGRNNAKRHVSELIHIEQFPTICPFWALKYH